VAPNGRREPGIYTRQSTSGDITFEIGWRDAQSKQRWRRVDGGLKAARAALAVEHARRGRGERVSADPRLRFDDAANAWWLARAVKLRPATQSAYRAGLVHLRDHFGKARMTDIGPSEVAAFVSKQQAAGFKGWTIKGQLTVLGSIFTYAARHLRFVGVNPVSLLDKTERPSSEDERPKRILSSDELTNLLDAVDESYRLLFELAAETGGRLSEVLGLTWECVDFDGGSIHFVQQLDRSGKLSRLKTARSRRWVEVTPPLVAELRAHKVASPRSGRHDLVFISRDGTPLDHRNVGGRVLTRAVRRAGLEDVERDGTVVLPAPTFHSLRHSHASALIAQGWDIEEVSSRLGHRDTAVTQRIYIRAFDQANRSDDRRRRLAALYRSAADSSLSLRMLGETT
jgi:integrase